MLVNMARVDEGIYKEPSYKKILKKIFVLLIGT